MPIHFAWLHVDPLSWVLMLLQKYGIFLLSWILIEESGGFIRSFDDMQIFPMKIGIDYSITSFPILAAATPALMEKGHALITRK